MPWRTSQGAGGLQTPQTRSKPSFFGQKLNFSGVIKRKKRNSFCIARKSGRNPGFLLIITRWGESGKAILQVSIAVFWALSKNFRAKMAPSPQKKIGPYAYEEHNRRNHSVQVVIGAGSARDLRHG